MDKLDKALGVRRSNLRETDARGIRPRQTMFVIVMLLNGDLDQARYQLIQHRPAKVELPQSVEAARKGQQKRLVLGDGGGRCREWITHGFGQPYNANGDNIGCGDADRGCVGFLKEGDFSGKIGGRGIIDLVIHHSFGELGAKQSQQEQGRDRVVPQQVGKQAASRRVIRYSEPEQSAGGTADLGLPVGPIIGKEGNIWSDIARDGRGQGADHIEHLAPDGIKAGVHVAQSKSQARQAEEATCGDARGDLKRDGTVGLEVGDGRRGGNGESTIPTQRCGDLRQGRADLPKMGEGRIFTERRGAVRIDPPRK